MAGGLMWRIHDSYAGLVNQIVEGKALVGFHMIYDFDLFHESGEIWENYDRINIWHPIQGAQTAGSARSYAEKLFMRTLFKVRTGEADADSQVQEFGQGMDPIPPSSPLAGAAPKPQQAPAPETKPAAQPAPLNSPDGLSPEQQAVMAQVANKMDVQAQEPDVQVLQDGTVVDANTGEVVDPDEGPRAPAEIGDAMPNAIAMPADAPFSQDEIVSVAKGFNQGLPVMQEPAAPGNHNWALVAEIFRVFAPLVPNEDALKGWWHENTAALGSLAAADEDLYSQVKGYFTSRRQELVPPQA